MSLTKSKSQGGPNSAGWRKKLACRRLIHHTQPKQHLTPTSKEIYSEAISRINARLLGRLDCHLLIWGSTGRVEAPAVFLGNSNRHFRLFLLWLHAIRRTRQCKRRHVDRSTQNDRTDEALPFLSAGSGVCRQTPSGFHADCTRQSLPDLARCHPVG